MAKDVSSLRTFRLCSMFHNNLKQTVCTDTTLFKRRLKFHLIQCAQSAVGAESETRNESNPILN